MSLPEMLDRMSIVKLKIERIGEPHLKQEYGEYEKAIKDFEKKGIKTKKEWLEELYKIKEESRGIYEKIEGTLFSLDRDLSSRVGGLEEDRRRL